MPLAHFGLNSARGSCHAAKIVVLISVGFCLVRTMSTESKSESPPTVCVITGASRGIGLAFVSMPSAIKASSPDLLLLQVNVLLQRKYVVVFAAVRTPSKAEALTALKSKHSSNLHILQLAVDDEKSIAAFAVELGKLTKYVDLLINNAGTLTWPDTPKNVTFKSLQSDFATNAVRMYCRPVRCLTGRCAVRPHDHHADAVPPAASGDQAARREVQVQSCQHLDGAGAVVATHR
jgi:NAD(P)-dependent dehydrogenase (short-subunit alcohol dehydrogenase family)